MKTLMEIYTEYATKVDPYDPTDGNFESIDEAQTTEGDRFGLDFTEVMDFSTNYQVLATLLHLSTVKHVGPGRSVTFTQMIDAMDAVLPGARNALIDAIACGIRAGIAVGSAYQRENITELNNLTGENRD